MTLFKQMALAISLIITLMLAAVMAINYQTAKQDMIQSLYQTTVNNISTLANNLANTNEDKALITTTIDAEFDSGYYQMIFYQSNDTNFNYKQIDNDPVEDVPQWFVEFTSIELQSITSDITSGWSMMGTISVKGDTGIVYRALYKMFYQLLYVFIISLSISLVVLSTILYFVLKPLSKIQKQAESILKNEFIIQKTIPFTTEFQDVVVGMNTMVQKVEEIFNKGNEAAQRNQELLYWDSVTKLFNRRYLMLKLQDLISIENKSNGGTIIFVALTGAEIINTLLGRQKTDGLFFELADIFNDTSREFEDKLIARVNGTEFTLMIPNCQTDDAYAIAKRINTRFNELLLSNNLDTTDVFINIGLYRYKQNVSVSELLTRADNALANAKADEHYNTYLYEEKNDENAMGKEQWREIIEDSIVNNHFSLKFWPTLNTKTNKIDHKVMTFTINSGDNKQYIYGDFIAPAINLGLVSKIYIVTLSDLITQQHKELGTHIYSVRLSNEFLKDQHSFIELCALFEKHAKILKLKLSFEVSDHFAMHNTSLVKSYVDLFYKYDFDFGINSFTGESSNFNYLKELSPKFLKADSAFLLDQSKDSMHAIQLITDSLGINIIASYVQTQEDLEKLKLININSIQGPITDTLS